jgi:23S rRNA pseudouridine2605 synthase
MPTPHKPSTLPQGFDRLERVMAEKGWASRREAKALVVKGEVKVNGKVVREPGFGVKATDKIEITSQAHSQKESVLVYKPRGIETSKTTPTAKDLHSEFPKLRHLHPIGRLDKDSEGLIIMSDDGTLAKALTKEGSSVGKEYMVTVREVVSDKSLEMMSAGIVIDGVITLPAKTKKVSDNVFTIVLHEGRKHQIRRMCDACRLTIEKLVRIKIGHLSIGSMRPSNVKNVSAEDVAKLKS